MNDTYLCLGGNIGDREKTIKFALLKISEQVGDITSKSSIYKTEAWGATNQQSYLNQCIKVKTKFTSLELINTLLSIEKEMGRERTLNLIYESRTIDIDILFFNNDIINLPQLIVPHPRLHLRKFVLIPLHEIASTHLHPILNKTIFNLLNECADISEVQQFNTLK